MRISESGGADRSGRLLDEFLDAPVQRVGHIDIVRGAHRDGVRLAELAERLALAAGDPEHVAGKIELEHLAGMAMGEPEVLVGRDEQAARRAWVLRLAQEGSVRVEHLDALVVAVGHVDEALGIDRHGMRDVELARSLALASPRRDEVAVAVELEYARLALAVTLHHVNVTVGGKGHVVRLVEQRQVAVRVAVAGRATYADR